MTTDKPNVDLNLDALAKEADTTPFTFVWKGKRYSMTHAAGLDAFALFGEMDRGEPGATVGTLRLALGDEAFGTLQSSQPPLGVLQETVKRYFRHSGMGPEGN